MKTGFIGAGKVGFTLGKFFSEKGVKVTGYASRNTSSAKEAAQFTSSRYFLEMGDLIQESDVLFLTVPDAAITPVWDQVRQYPIRGKYICHCSGARSAEDAFPGIQQTGAYEYSVHPLFAVSDAYTAYQKIPDVFFTIEGNTAHLGKMMEFLKNAGLQVQVIDPSCKTKYHAAASVASNLVIGLLDMSLSMLEECGFSREAALGALTPLVRGNVEHVLTDGPAASLTGPVERGDTETVNKHLNCLDTPSDRALYSLLSERLIPLAKAKHPERSYRPLEELLRSFEQEEL